MKMNAVRRVGRQAWTMVELLIVIAIIAVLMSLSLAAVLKFLSKPPEVTARKDISDLERGIEEFKGSTKAEYIPSRLKVARRWTSTTYPNASIPGSLDAESIEFITRAIGNNSPGFKTQWQSAAGIQWTSTMTGTTDLANVEILEGHQCLVFCLGGIQVFDGTQYSCTGFSEDKAHPDAVGGDRRGHFSFDPKRLSIPAGKKHFCAYEDAYGARPGGNKQYYAYFCAYKKENGYNRYGVDNKGNVLPVSSTAPVTSDCASLGVWPYASSARPLTYLNSTSHQIICAGADGNFGPGTDFSKPTGQYYWNNATFGSIPTAGQDDQANFAKGKLQFGE